MTDGGLMLGDLDVMMAPYAAEVGTSFGAWTAITSETSSLFLDGSVISGEQSANRQVVLRVRIEADDRYSLSEACEALLAEANKQSNTLAVTLPDGPTFVYEVFRVQSPERDDDESEAWNRRTYVLTFPARPFARSVDRETTGALAPAITISNFEGTFNGLALGSFVSGASYQWVTPTKAAGAALDVDGSVVFEASVNCTLTSTTNTVSTGSGGSVVESVYRLTQSAAGSMEARATTTYATTAGKVVSAVVGVVNSGGIAGLEWLDTNGATLATTWGHAITQWNAGQRVAAWVSGIAPTNATAYRIRVKFPQGGTRDILQGATAAAQAALGDTDRRITSTFYDGSKGMMANANAPTGATRTDSGNEVVSFIYEQLASPLNISSKPRVGLWIRPVSLSPNITNDGPYFVSICLYDTSGRWSRWNMDSGYLASATWQQVSRALADTPDATATTGAADLTAISAYSVDIGGFAAAIDRIEAADKPTVTTSPRGTVFELSPIKGSARTTAQVEISAGLAMTDWLVAAVSSDAGFPMLTVSSGKATAGAPASYNGVYSIIGTVPSGATSIGTSLTITQKINGTQVATKTLTGTARSGGHYIDFGATALPLVAVANENQATSLEFAFAASSSGEVLLIDVDASLAWADNLSTSQAYAWIDEPDPAAALGNVWVGSASDRSDARALINPPTLSRPLQVKAPSTRLLVYSTTTAPNVTLDYYPRWLIEPTT